MIEKELKGESECTWKKRYSSGKKGVKDYVNYYYKDSGERIVIEYTDWRHKIIKNYIAKDKDSHTVKITTNLDEAKKAIEA